MLAVEVASRGSAEVVGVAAPSGSPEEHRHLQGDRDQVEAAGGVRRWGEGGGKTRRAGSRCSLMILGRHCRESQ